MIYLWAIIMVGVLWSTEILSLGHDLKIRTSSSLENLIEKEVIVVYKS